MEMGASQLAIRIVGSIGRIDQGRLRTGKLQDEEWPRLAEAVERLRTVSLSIDETPGLTPSELRASARRGSTTQGQGIQALSPCAPDRFVAIVSWPGCCATGRAFAASPLKNVFWPLVARA
jgi:hypothetical protein